MKSIMQWCYLKPLPWNAIWEDWQVPDYPLYHGGFHMHQFTYLCGEWEMSVWSHFFLQWKVTCQLNHGKDIYLIKKHFIQLWCDMQNQYDSGHWSGLLLRTWIQVQNYEEWVYVMKDFLKHLNIALWQYICIRVLLKRNAASYWS